MWYKDHHTLYGGAIKKGENLIPGKIFHYNKIACKPEFLTRWIQYIYCIIKACVHACPSPLLFNLWLAYII